MHSNKHPGLQQHSVGELYPFIMVAFGDGSWQWVNHEKKWAGWRNSSQEYALTSMRAAAGLRPTWVAAFQPDWERNYAEFMAGSAPPPIAPPPQPDRPKLPPVFRTRFRDGSIRWLSSAELSKVLNGDGEMPVGIHKFTEEK